MHLALARAATIAAGCAAAMTGCSGDEPQSPTLPPAPSSAPISAAPSSTPSPTEEQAVEAAVRFYYDGFNRAFQSRDAKELAMGSTPDCTCRAAVDQVAQVVAKGRVDGGNVIVQNLAIAEVLPTLATVNVSLDSRGGQIVGGDGTVVDDFRGEGNVRKAVFLRKVAGRWLPFRIELLRG